METRNFHKNITVDGYLQVGGAIQNLIVGTPWYAVSTVIASGDGRTAANAFKTIAEAVAAASAGDKIYLKGSFNEAVICTLNNVSFIGVGNEPSQATWTAPTVADSFCLHLNAAQSCVVQNIKFRPVVYVTSGVPSGIRMTNAHYTQILGCRFQGQAGSIAAIYSPVSTTNTSNILIQDCEFMYMNNITTTPYGAAIYGTEAAGSYHSAWRIINCSFHSCTTCIDACLRVSIIKGCVFDEYGVTALSALAAVMGVTHGVGIDLSGSGSGANMVVECQLGGAYSSTLYKVGASGDNWNGNFAISGTGVTYGVTFANPA